MSASDKPEVAIPLAVRRQQLKSYFLLYMLSWIALPLGGWRPIAFLALHDSAGFYYFGNVGDANHYAVSGPYRSRRAAWRDGRSKSSGISFNRPHVFLLWTPPEDYYDVRWPRKSHHFLWPFA